jgi:iron(III) transport system ATP-binding protein
MSLLELRGVTKRYGPVTALRDFDLSIPAGTRTAIVCPSGSGKTTLLRLVAGFEQPDAGEIFLDGQKLCDAAGGVPAHRRNIGLVMQDGALFPHLTVLRNILFGFERGTSEAKRQALELMDTVQLDRSMASRRPHELSGGQQQRVALARALARRPRLMLLDEPFSALDSGLREQMRNAVAGILAAAKITTVLVTHDQAEAMGFADRVVILRDGALSQAGTPREVYLSPVNRETAEFLGPAIILDAVAANGVARSTLGPVPVPAAASGPVRIMLRHEQITLRLANGHDDGATRVRVLATDFLGPNGTLTIVLPGTDRPFVLRVTGQALPPVGSELAVSVSGEAHVLDG